ncbi:glycosyltransferase family 1 protein [bacterium]|jgi:hypothetical protein|nr:glycosyltransferase family 1 protein [bacterium]
MKLVGKRILIVSPQVWEGLKVSKHHYAEELAQRGNQVFFLEPPAYGNRSVQIKKVDENISVVSYHFFPGKRLRFHFRKIHDFFISLYIKQIIKQLGNLDVVWCFEPNLYTNLKLFGAKMVIYHPVDALSLPHQINVGKSANVIFSVSDSILAQFNSLKTPSFFINHGLSASFLQQLEFKQFEKVRFAYIGNVMINGLDRNSLMKVIENHPEIGFDFYGSYDKNSNDSFINFILRQPNATLLGRKSPKELANLLVDYSGYMMCYSPNIEINGGANSHKLLEYLSFGKVIIANKVFHYEQYRDLIQMSTQFDNSDYVALFDETLLSIDKYNTIELFNKRRALAFENTYANQVDRIENHLNEVML